MSDTPAGATRIRLITPEDAPALLGLLVENEAFLTPFLPAPPSPEPFSLERQHEHIATALANHANGTLMPYVILAPDSCTASRRAPWSTTTPPSGCSRGTVSAATASPRGT